MNRRNFAVVTVLLAMLFTSAARAHDPAEHAAEAAAPDCRALGDAVNGPMDRNDPVIQAMMKQCGEAADRSHGHDGESPDHHAAGSGHSSEQDVKAQ
ncbi:MAG: hypothetical protein R3F45_15565 [Gammaproteobacteria bacterium]